MRQLKLIGLLVIGLISHASVEAACTQTKNKVGFVGLDGGDGRVYVALSNHSNQCGCGNVRFLPNNTKTDMALGILLTARLANKTVRIDIIQEGNCDSGYRVYIE